MSVSIDLSGKTALVMGVANARSLGWAIAQQLLAAGCRVGFSYQGERLKGELDKLLAGHENVWTQQADATSEDDLGALFGRVKDEFGGWTTSCIPSRSRRAPPWTAGSWTPPKPTGTPP